MTVKSQSIAAVVNRETTGSPVYRQIEADLRHRIERGDWRVGTMLPGRRDLAREYSVDLMTLQRSIGALLEDGTLVASGGRGTFVRHATMRDRSTSPRSERPTKPLKIGIIGSNVSETALSEPIKLFFAYTFLSNFEAEFRRSQQVDFTYADRPGNNYSISAAMEQITNLEMDGAVFLFEQSESDASEIAQISMKSSIPVVLAADRHIATPIPVVYYDNFAAGFDAARHMLRVANELCVVSPFDVFYTHDRIAGMRAAVQSAGLPEGALTIWPKVRPTSADNDQVRAARYAGEELLRLHPSKKAILAINDLTAIGIQEAASEIGLQAGHDFAMIGFDDLPQAAMCGISSMQPPLAQLACESASMLLRLINGDLQAMQIRLKSNLIERASFRSVTQSTSEEHNYE